MEEGGGGLQGNCNQMEMEMRLEMEMAKKTVILAKIVARIASLLPFDNKEEATSRLDYQKQQEQCKWRGQWTAGGRPVTEEEGNRNSKQYGRCIRTSITP